MKHQEPPRGFLTLRSQSTTKMQKKIGRKKKRFLESGTILHLFYLIAFPHL